MQHGGEDFQLLDGVMLFGYAIPHDAPVPAAVPTSGFRIPCIQLRGCIPRGASTGESVCRSCGDCDESLASGHCRR